MYVRFGGCTAAGVAAGKASHAPACVKRGSARRHFTAAAPEACVSCGGHHDQTARGHPRAKCAGVQLRGVRCLHTTVLHRHDSPWLHQRKDRAEARSEVTMSATHTLATGVMIDSSWRGGTWWGHRQRAALCAEALVVATLRSLSGSVRFFRKAACG